MSLVPPDNNIHGLTLRGGLSLTDESSWANFRNPVLREVSKQAQKHSPEPGHDPHTVIDIPCPEYLYFDLVYRGTSLQAGVTPGQQLSKGAPLNHKQIKSHGKQLIPSVLCPVPAMVESIEHSGINHCPRVVLRVQNANAEIADQNSKARTDPNKAEDNNPENLQQGILPWYCSTWKMLNREQRWQAVRESSIRGHGGGGFLLADKAGHHIDTLIVNAVECEPLISCDAALIRHQATEALQGIISLVELTSCHECIIALEIGREWQIDLLQQAKADLYTKYKITQYHQELQSLCDRLSFLTVPAIYPQGAERMLFKTVTGRTLKANEIPGDTGVCCTNIATCHALHHLSHTGFPESMRIVTLTGDALYESEWGMPVNVRATYGTPVSLLLKTAGINTESVRLQLGGPVCGKELGSAEYSVDAATNCIVVSKTQAMQQSDNCIRCGNCVDVCPVSLLPQQLHLAINSNNQKLTNEYNLCDCLECGCCDLVCPSNIPLTGQFRKARKDATAQAIKTDAATLALQRYENREARLKRRDIARTEQRNQRKQATGDKTQQKQEIAEALARARKKT